MLHGGPSVVTWVPKSIGGGQSRDRSDVVEGLDLLLALKVKEEKQPRTMESLWKLVKVTEENEFSEPPERNTALLTTPGF